MTNKCLFVLNPKSGKETIEIDEFEDFLKEKLPKFDLHLIQTEGEDDQTLIKNAIEEIQPQLVLVGGGDGTVRLVAAALIHKDIPLGIIPMGSANGLATCFGLNNIDVAWEAVSAGNVKLIDVLKINEEISLHLADFGFNANLIEKFEEGDTRGMIGYVRSSFQEIFNTEEKLFEVNLNEQQIKIACKMLVIANGDRYGTGAFINPQSKIDDGWFEVIALNPDSLEDYVKTSLAFFNGTLKEIESVNHWSCQSCEIFNLEATNFQIDGDLMGNPEKVKVEILTKAIPIIFSEEQ